MLATQYKLLKSGSVKDIYQISKSEVGFKFSDRYSVFDWGEMPDLIKNKGESLCIIGQAFFELLEGPKFWSEFLLSLEDNADSVLTKSERSLLLRLKDSGLNTHYKRREGDFLIVEKVDAYPPEFKAGSYDYSSYQNRDTQRPFLIPLECIFRFGVPRGSSILKRVDNLEYQKFLGLNSPPKEGDTYSSPLIEFSTKLEAEDRYLCSLDEIKRVCDCESEFIVELTTYNLVLAKALKWFFSLIDFELWDGKFEWAYHPQKGFMLIDSIGPDELRLVYKQVQISKEVLRQYYKESDWAKSVGVAKKIASSSGRDDEWKKICQSELNSFPEGLSKKVLLIVEEMYMSLAQNIYKKVKELQGPTNQDEKFFSDIRWGREIKLEDVVKDIQSEIRI